MLQPESGDIVLFGAYDGYEIVSFDDQVGAHGSLGGPQVHPFLLAPAHLGVEQATLENARDIHRVVMTRYARGAGTGAVPGPAANVEPRPADAPLSSNA